MASNRKQELLALLKGAKESMNGQSLAEHFGVTRQIIVQDIALLRADGAQIISTNRGYIYKSSDDNSYVHRLFKVNHKVSDMEDELLAIVDNGGRIQNIMIDHPVYGEIQTLLKDKISIRAIQIYNGKVWYAGTDSKFGYVSLKDSTKKMQKIMKKFIMKKIIQMKE